MGFPLAAKDVVISTAVVEIKTIVVSGKQMTISLFNQIIQEDICCIFPDDPNDDANDILLDGIPWGTINYHHKCPSPRGHWHLIWQKGSELRQCTVYRSFSLLLESEYIEARGRERELIVSNCNQLINIVKTLPQLFIAT